MATIATEENNFGYKPLEGEEPKSRKNYPAACVALVCLIASWQGMGEIVQATLTTTYDHPYFVVWTLHCTFCVWLLIIPGCYCYYGKTPISLGPRTWLKAFAFNCLLLVADYTWYISLKHTIVAANNAIYQCNCAFVYIMSIIVLGERFSILRVLSMMVCVGGMVIVVFKTDVNTDHVTGTPVGYATVVLSVAIFAFYEICYEKFYPGEHDDEEKDPLRENLPEGIRPPSRDEGVTSYDNTHLNVKIGKQWETLSFTGCMGAMNLLIMWFPIFILNATEYEKFVWPNTNRIRERMLANCLLGAIYTPSYLAGIAFTSPFFMSLGALLVIPVGVITDYFLHGVVIPPLSGLGMGVIGLGFLLSVLVARCEQMREAKRTSS